MDLRNWELFTITGNPVVGATVEVREATLTHPNTGTVIASTVTNGDGMYSFTGLPEGEKDVKLIYQGKIKWLKGMTRHSISLAIGEDFVPPDVNLIKNGGFEGWRLASYQVATIDTPLAYAWLGKIGVGDTALVTQETSVIAATRSRCSLKAVYTKAAGPLYIYQLLPPSLTAQLRGETITLTVSARRGVNGSAQACIREDGADTLGTADSGTGSFGVLEVTKTIGLTAQVVYVGAKINLSDTIYLDNTTLVVGAEPGVFQPRVAGSDVDQIDYTMLDRVYSRHFLTGAG